MFFLTFPYQLQCGNEMLYSLQLKYLTPACLLYVHIVKNILSSVFTIQFQVTVQIETV